MHLADLNEIWLDFGYGVNDEFSFSVRGICFCPKFKVTEIYLVFTAFLVINEVGGLIGHVGYGKPTVACIHPC